MSKVAIVGVEGSGKTVLMMVLSGGRVPMYGVGFIVTHEARE